MNKKMITIPIAFCFDNNYVIPAAVAFYSLLENASRDYQYHLHVMHSDISEENQKKLQETVNVFSDFASLSFVDMSHRFADLWESVGTKGHFTKEVMYKVLVASIFPQYDKLIVSDVDVVFLGDISPSYVSLSNDDVYLTGVKFVGRIAHYMNVYKSKFTEDEIECLSGFCGGYLIFHLDKLRQDNKEADFIECFKQNGDRLNQMEQDVLNLCCYPKISYLPLSYLICSYTWDLYDIEKCDFEDESFYSKQNIIDSMNAPIQLHYATSTKPWNKVDCTKSEEWFKYLSKTVFLKEYLKKLAERLAVPPVTNNLVTTEPRGGVCGLLNKYAKKLYNAVCN